MSTPSSIRRVAALSVAALAAAGLNALAPSATGQGNPDAVDAVTRVHWAHGKALGARSPKGADAAVRGYLATHGLGKATADSLRAESQWTVRGVTLLRLQQYAAGLRVVGSDVKAAIKDGRPVSVIENASAFGKPTAARLSADDAKRVAIDSIYHGRAVDMLQAPGVERVAVPMSNGGLAEGFLVTTWDTDNQLRETLVDGSGAVVHSQLRTAEDGYNVFAEDPDTSAQTLVSNPADPGASPLGWLFRRRSTPTTSPATTPTPTSTPTPTTGPTRVARSTATASSTRSSTRPRSRRPATTRRSRSRTSSTSTT